MSDNTSSTYQHIVEYGRIDIPDQLVVLRKIHSSLDIAYMP